MTTITATEIHNNFGHYLRLIQSGEEIIILKKGKEFARLISHKSGYVCRKDRKV